MTFSVIIPVYNVEKYLAKCIDSLLAQSCKDYEIIVVNDGSPDGCQSIIDSYTARYPDLIKGFVKENGGLSDARNYGVERARGDYLVFVDSDDYVVADMLEKLKEIVDKDKPDVLGFGHVSVDEEGNTLRVTTKPEIRNLSGEDALIALVNHREMFESAWGYVYSREYWYKMGFSFMKGIYHEDFALIPNVILRGGKVSCISYGAYCYLIRQGSITNVQTDERARKLAGDMLKGYDFLASELEKHPAENKYAAKLYMSYAANALLCRFGSLGGENKKWFKTELKKRKVTNFIANDTLARKLKKNYIKLRYGI